MSWDKQPLPSNAYHDINADLEEKEVIEREITRRGVTDYHWPPSVTCSAWKRDGALQSDCGG